MAQSARKSQHRRYGTAAYQEGSAVRRTREQEQLGPHALPKQRTLSRPKVQHRAAGQVSLFAVAGAIAVAALSVAVLWQYVTLTTLSDSVVSLQKEYTTLKSEEARLLAQYELAYDLKSIEAAVTADGRMVKPQSSQIYYMDLSGSDSVEVFEEETRASLGDTLDALLAKVSEYLS